MKDKVKKKRISVASAKNKGREFQKWIGNRFSEITGIPFGKDCPIASREMGGSGTDLRLVGEGTLKVIPYSIEAKRCENWAVHSWIDQAKANLLPDTDWLLFAKRNHSKPIVIMDAETFFKLFEQNHICICSTDKDKK